MTKDYMKSTITWQAHTVMKVEQMCIDGGIFPNGKKMTAKDIEESKYQIQICRQVLREHGIIVDNFKPKQLVLF